MKKIQIVVFALQVVNLSFGMQEKGLLIYREQSIAFFPIASMQWSMPCNPRDLMEILASGVSHIPLDGPTSVDIPIERKNLIEVLQQSVQNFPPNIYEIKDCQITSQNNSSYLSGYLRNGWNKDIPDCGITFFDDKNQAYQICNSSQSKINVLIARAVNNRTPFLLSVYSIDNPQKKLELLVNKFSSATMQQSVPATQTSVQSFDGSNILSDEDDCFNFENDISNESCQNRIQKCVQASNKIELHDDKPIMTSQSTSWKNLLYIGVPVAGLMAFLVVLWHQGHLSFNTY